MMELWHLLLFLIVCDVVWVSAIIFTRRSIYARLDKGDERYSQLEGKVNDMNRDAQARHIGVVMAIRTGIQDALAPINNRLDKQDRDIAEIKDICMYLANSNSEKADATAYTPPSDRQARQE